MFSFLDLPQSRSIIASIFDVIMRTIPIPFDKLQVKLEVRKCVIDPKIDAIASDIIQFWLSVHTVCALTSYHLSKTCMF